MVTSIEQMSLWVWYMQCSNASNSYTPLWSLVLCFPFILIVETNIEIKIAFQQQIFSALVLLVTNNQMLHAVTFLLDQTLELMVNMNIIVKI